MRKMLLATALALLITGCAQQTFTVQNKPAAVAPRKPSPPSFLRFWNWAEENCRCSQNCGGAKSIVKTETQQTFVNGLLGFITFETLLTPLEARVCAHNNCMSCPSIWATLSLLINILQVPSVVFA